ncbi:MAG: YfhO family protein [Clostridiales bacterium]|nr:YfhO family protein [Clostridiales bacterium]
METESVQINEIKQEITKEQPGICMLSYKWLLFLSFLLPFTICCIVYIAGGFYPFGNKQIIVTDFWHQYYAMICEFREKLLSGGSLFYTWHSGLGSNFLSMIGYYCASPLNLLTVLIPEGGLRIGVTLIVFIKIGLCGLTSSVCLINVTKKRDLSVVFFSGLFALCAFIMGYYWNLMWLDSVALFPLVMLGVLHLIRDKKPLLYTASLFFCVLFNYYIGFYVCIAVFFVCIAIAIICWKGMTDAIRSFFRTVFHSAIALGLSMPLLLPSYLSLQNTYAASTGGIGSKLFNGSVPEFLSALLPYQYPNTKDLNTPNLCCGFICLILFVLFLTGHFKIREKICACGLLTLLFASFIIRPLDWLWNGGHYTNMIPFRYSFIFSFILVLLAYRVFIQLEKVKPWQIAVAAEVCLVGIILLYPYTGLLVTLLCVLTLAVYTILLFLYHKHKLSSRLFSGAICLAICVELGCAGALGISSYSVYDSYLQESDEIKTLAAIGQEKELVRTEVSSYKTLNDPLLYGYNGVSQFSSGANYGVSSLLTKLGAGGYTAGNRYAYVQSTPVSMSLLGVKYIISKSATNTGDHTLQKIEEAGHSALYEYTDHLPIAFMMKGGTEPALTSLNPFDNQASLLSQMTGNNLSWQSAKPLFTECDYPTVKAENGSISGSEGYYTIENKENTAVISFTYICDRTGLYYIYPQIQDINNLSIKYKDQQTSLFSHKASQACVLPAGFHEAGDTFTVTCSVSTSERSHSARISAACLNEEVFNQSIDFLRQNKLTDIHYTDTSVSGHMSAAYDGYLYTSIPYEKGWSVYINGEKRETECYAGAFVTVPLSDGDYDIEFRYVPDGFYTGLLFFGICLILLILSILFYQTRKSKNK